MIVKIQRPLNEPNAPWYFYDKTRRKLKALRAPTALEAEAMGDELKIYAEYRRDSAGNWTFMAPAPAQDF